VTDTSSPDFVPSPQMLERAPVCSCGGRVPSVTSWEGDGNRDPDVTTGPNPFAMPPDYATDEPAQTDPATWLDRYGDILFRHALLRVRRHELAEDLVQETLLAALDARKRFSGNSSEQTWLISILRRKIVDHLRKASRAHLQEGSFQGGPEFFGPDRHWKSRLRPWPGDPQGALESAEFWQVVERCLSQLPSTVAGAFVLKELDGLARKDVCNALQITQSNLSVRLHRARLLMQHCLDRNWFSAND
jgi:RNA polymerase sigma-70 factor (ECF subfamily)